VLTLMVGADGPTDVRFQEGQLFSSEATRAGRPLGDPLEALDAVGANRSSSERRKETGRGESLAVGACMREEG